MKKIQRRDKLKLYGDLLSALSSKSGAEKIVLTQVQMKVNVSFDRMKAYIKDLVDLGLVQDEDAPRLTEKGIQYLREYEKVLDFIKRMGLSYR